jgi:S1-C subfamily serine protease
MNLKILRGRMLRASCAMLLLLPAWPVASAGEAGAESSIEDSVVRIFVAQRGPAANAPWNRVSREVTGSGLVIEGNRILTNAHVVTFAAQLQIQGQQGGDKYIATVESVATAMDLAVLKVEDPAFFTGRKPIVRSDKLPSIKDNVLVYGFPTGGQALSITKGIVSRIEFTGYNYPTSGLRIQIDAAINPGNSGGPALVDDRMIGIAFSNLGGAQGIGYIIPNEEIELFLKDVGDGRYDGKPTFHDDVQTLENPALRAYMKLPAEAHGVVVRTPYSGATGNPLREWDLITEMGGTPVNDQGLVALSGNLKVSFRYLAQRHARDGKVPVTVIREGKARKLEIPVPPWRPLLIPSLEGETPQWFIYGALPFTAASYQLAALLTRNAGAAEAMLRMGSPLFTQRADYPTPEQQELVVFAAPFFPHRLVNGYSSAPNGVIHSLNGVRVRSLAHLVEMLRDTKEDFLVFRLASARGETFVFPRADMQAATEQVLRENGIREQGSPELISIWQKK